MWFWASLALMIVAHDAWFYWAHRLMHRPALFRIFHRRHHRSNNPSPFTAYSFDLAEAVVQSAFVPLWMLATPTPWPVIGLFVLHQIVRNTIGHSGYELFPARRDGRPLIPFLTTVTHHDLHHAQAAGTTACTSRGGTAGWHRAPGVSGAVRTGVASRAVFRVGREAWRGCDPCAVPDPMIAAPSTSRAQMAKAVSGDWVTPGLGGLVRLAPCTDDGSKLCGRLIWVLDERRVRRGTIGTEIIRGLAWRDGAWRDGTMLNPEDGMVYKGSIRLVAGSARVSGCIGPLCQDQIWRPLASIPRPLRPQVGG